MMKLGYLGATLGLLATAGVGFSGAAIAQTSTSPSPTMSNNPGAAADTSGTMAGTGDTGMSPGNDTMATPASPDSSMSHGPVGRKHMKHHNGSTMTPSATGDTTSNTMSNTTSPQ